MKYRSIVIFLLITIAALAAFCSCAQAPDPAVTGRETQAIPAETATETPGQPHVHSYGAWSVTKAATCTEDGVKSRSCACGDTETKTIPAAHQPVEDQPIEPTCTEAGRTAGSHCLICGAVLTAPEDVAPIGHSYGDDGRCVRCGAPDPSVTVFIDSAEGLLAISRNMAANYVLTSDIDLTSARWISIGSEDEPFTGIFDGAGHTVKFQKFTLTSERGLFSVNSGRISNLTVSAEGAEIADSGYTGAYIAVINNGTIENCVIKGDRDYRFSVAQNVAGSDPSSGENRTGAAQDIRADFSFGEFCCVNNGRIVLCKNSGTVTVSHSVYAAHWGHGYGVPIITMNPYIALESNDHLYIYSDVTFGGLCADNNGEADSCVLGSAVRYSESVSTATQYSAWWYAWCRVSTNVKAGAVCGINSKTIKDVSSGMLSLDRQELSNRTQSDHESIAFDFARSGEYAGLIAENKGSCSGISYN